MTGAGLGGESPAPTSLDTTNAALQASGYPTMVPKPPPVPQSPGSLNQHPGKLRYRPIKAATNEGCCRSHLGL